MSFIDRKLKKKEITLKTNVIYKENSSQEAKFRPYFSRVPTNCNLYAYGANNPVHYIDPDGNWTVSAGASFSGMAIKGKFGHNEGKWEFEWRIGVGIGFEASIDFNDKSFTDGNSLGIYAEAEAGASMGSFSLDTETSVGVENCEIKSDASVSISDTGGNSYELEISDGNITLEPNSVDGTVDSSFGTDAMLFFGVGGSGVLHED